MKYPKIKVPRKCFVVFKPNHKSPRVQLSGKSEHFEWVVHFHAEAEKNVKDPHVARNEADSMRMFWRTIITFLNELEKPGTISVRVWDVRGEMSQVRGFRDEAFTAATKALFKVS